MDAGAQFYSTLAICVFNILQYRATDFVVPGDGRVEISYTPAAGGEPIRHIVYDFKGTGGVALAMYNTDEVCQLSNDHGSWLQHYSKYFEISFYYKEMH
jgi:hypothetical protein